MRKPTHGVPWIDYDEEELHQEIAHLTKLIP